MVRSESIIITITTAGTIATTMGGIADITSTGVTTANTGTIKAATPKKLAFVRAFFFGDVSK